MATITPDQSQIVAKLPRRSGRLQLASFLGWESFDEEDAFQRAILLDYLYDSFVFTVEKGFPWVTVCKLLKITDEMLEQSKGKKLLDSVKIFSNKMKDLVTTVSENNLKTYTGFFFDTFFHHYKLYQCVFTTEQDKLQIKMDLPVFVPPIPCPSKDGKDIAIWEYEEKIDAIQEREQAAKVEREVRLRKMKDEHKRMLEDNQSKVENTHMPLERQELLDIMREVAATQLTAVSEDIRHNIHSSMEDLGFKLEKTAIPRPAALARPSWLPPEEEIEEERVNTVMSMRTFTAQGRGAPPRFKPTIVETGSKKTSIRNSSRLSKKSTFKKSH